MRRASTSDISLLVDLMAEFYAESGYELDLRHATDSFRTLLEDDRLGRVWVIEADGADAGHMVLTFRYAMEYGGLVGCLDDLFVKPSFRNRGLSTTALRSLVEHCREMNVRAITVEVGFGNGPAQTVYRRAGFLELPDRQLLALSLAPPTHVL